MRTNNAMRPVIPGVALMTLAAILTVPAIAQQASGSQAGRLLASNCFQCHSVTGDNSGFENLKGESANEIYQELLEFKSGKEGNGLMARHAMGYTDAQLRAIADYLATLR